MAFTTSTRNGPVSDGPSTRVRSNSFAGTVTGQYVPYVVPQEHGNRTCLRWLAVSNGAAGVRFTPARPCEGSASHFTPADLFAATHAHQLTPRPETLLNLDVAQRGLGTLYRLSHPSPEGARLIAEAIAAELEKRQLLPK